MPVSEAKKKANAKWNASKDNIMIRPDKDTGAAIREAAASTQRSVTQYILDAVDAYRNGEDALPLDYAAIRAHAEKTGETVPAFVQRAVSNQVERDNMEFKMGLKPKIDAPQH